MAVGRRKSNSGFTLIEVAVAGVVLTAGLLSVISLFVYCLSTLQSAQQDLIARQKAKEALESVFAARDTGQVTYDQIQNVAAGSPGLFLSGFLPIYNPPGSDGLINTADDATSPNSKLDEIVLPGPDGLLGTADDIHQALLNFKRQITISPVLSANGTVNPDIRLVTITVQYIVPQFGTKQYQVSSYISRYR